MCKIDRQNIVDLRYEEYVHWYSRSARHDTSDDKLYNAMRESEWQGLGGHQ